MTRKELGEKVFAAGNKMLLQCYLTEYGNLNPDGIVGDTDAAWYDEALRDTSGCYEDDIYIDWEGC
jgi:hypothetical protein